MKILVRDSDSRVIHAGTDLVLTDTELQGHGWVDHNYHTGNAKLIADVELPAYWTGGVWSFIDGVWAVVDADRHAEIMAIAEAENNKRTAANIDLLWQAATAYQKQYIADLAIGVLTIGVIRGLPKALAVEAWASNLWNGMYYPRRAAMTAEYLPELYDFSAAGPMPYSVQELNAELNGL